MNLPDADKPKQKRARFWRRRSAAKPNDAAKPGDVPNPDDDLDYSIVDYLAAFDNPANRSPNPINGNAEKNPDGSPKVDPAKKAQAEAQKRNTAPELDYSIVDHMQTMGIDPSPKNLANKHRPRIATPAESAEMRQEDRRKKDAKSGLSYWLWLLNLKTVKDPFTTFAAKIKHGNNPANQRGLYGGLRGMLIRQKIRMARVVKRLKAASNFAAKAGRVAQKASRPLRPLMESKFVLSKINSVGHAFAPAAKFMKSPLMKKVGEMALTRFAKRVAGLGLKIGTGLAIGALALTPVGWSIGGIALATAVAIGSTMLVDFAFDAAKKYFKGQASSPWDAAKKTASEWGGSAWAGIKGLGKDIVTFNARGVYSDLKQFVYLTANAASGDMLELVNQPSVGTAAKLFVNYQLLPLRTVRMVLDVGGAAVMHPRATFKLTEEILSGSWDALKMGSRVAHAIMHDPTLSHGAELTAEVGGAALGVRELGIIGGRTIGRPLGRAARYAALLGVAGTVAYEGLDHIPDGGTYAALKAVWNGGSDLVKIAEANPDLTADVGMAGVAYLGAKRTERGLNRLVPSMGIPGLR